MHAALGAEGWAERIRERGESRVLWDEGAIEATILAAFCVAAFVDEAGGSAERTVNDRCDDEENEPDCGEFVRCDACEQRRGDNHWCRACDCGAWH